MSLTGVPAQKRSASLLEDVSTSQPPENDLRRPLSRPTIVAMDDEAFIAHVTERLAGLPGVEAVALGGSRATETNRPDSDWDFSVYYWGYENTFAPDYLEAVGWQGKVSPIGGWGGGVFNGGAWLTVDDRPIDVHYRALQEVERCLRDAQEGDFWVERLLFHLAGIPSYIVVAELAINRVLYGELPRPTYPRALRTSARDRWLSDAQLTLGYARVNHAAHGRLTDCVGAIAVATAQAAHAVLASRGEWITNEKTLIERAGLRRVDDIVAALTAHPEVLTAALDRTSDLLREAVENA
jgi:predicted nucleotidyltransferase